MITLAALLRTVLFALAFWQGGCACAQSLVLVTGEWRPFLSESLPNNGPVAEVVMASMKAAGLDASVAFYPWVRAEKMAASAEVFAAFPYATTAERRAQYLISDPILTLQTRLLIYLGNAKTPPSAVNWKLDAIKAASMGVPRGSHRLTQVRAQAYPNIVETADVDNSVRMLRAGRFDLLAEVPVIAFDSIRRLYPAEADKFLVLDVTPFPMHDNTLIVGQSYPNAAEIIKKFNGGLALIRKSGEYDRIMGRYQDAQRKSGG